MSTVQRVAERRTAPLACVDSQPTHDDRTSLLATHHATAKRTTDSSGLGIGSHLGGTLQGIIANLRCRRTISIDPPPAAQPDDRGQICAYRRQQQLV